MLNRIQVENILSRHIENGKPAPGREHIYHLCQDWLRFDGLRESAKSALAISKRLPDPDMGEQRTTAAAIRSTLGDSLTTLASSPPVDLEAKRPS